MNSKSEKTQAKYNFGLIRLSLSFLVIFEHSFTLGGFGEDPIATLTNAQTSSAFLAVMSFFVISGFLVTKSSIDTQSFWLFGIKRFLRIMPGFWMCLIVVAFGFAPLFYYFENGYSLAGFLKATPTNSFEFIVANSALLIRHYSIGDILSSNIFPNVLNGSLWTLFLELRSYFLIGVLGAMGILVKKKGLLLVMYTILFGYIAANFTIQHITNPFIRLVFDHYFLIFLCYFLGGSILYIYREQIKYSYKIAAFLFVLLLFGFVFEIGRIILPICMPYLTILFSTKIPRTIFDKKIDLSYGIYIYSFPVMQALVFFGLNHSQFIYFVLSIIFTLPFALFSWYFIEKPALRIKRKIQLDKNSLPQFGQ